MSSPNASMITQASSPNSTSATGMPSAQPLLFRPNSLPIWARVSMMPNRNSTITAPMYTSTCETATNSAAARMYWAATPDSTTTSQSAAWTTLLVDTTLSAAKIMAAAMMPKPTFWATFTSSAARMRAFTSARSIRRSSFLLGSRFEFRCLGNRLHPLAELLLVVEQVGDLRLGVLVLGAPEQRVERTHLDTDAAVHAQRVVDVEPVEMVDLARLATGPARGCQLLVALDVDAPVGARPRAQHARSAVALVQGDDATGTDRGCFLLVRVLHRVGTVDDGVLEDPERDAETLEEAGDLGLVRHCELRASEHDLEDGRDGSVGESQRDEHLPGEGLQLILAEAGKAEAHPHDDEGEHQHLGEHDQRTADVHPVVDAVDRGPTEPVERDAPAAEEQHRGEQREDAGGGELGDEEDQETEARVLGHVARHEFGFGDRHVERRLGQLGLHGDHEDQEPDELGEDVRVPDAAPTEDLPGVLGDHDLLQVHRAGLDDHADHGEHHRQFVGDQLAGGAQTAEQRVLAGARPTGDEDAEHADRGDGQGIEDADLEVGEQRIGTERNDDDEQERRQQHHDRGDLEDALVGGIGSEVLLLHPLADLGNELQRPVRAGFHRTEPALHERHHLEQAQVHDRAGRQQHRDEPAEHAQQRLPPVGNFDGELDHRSMSPRMK